MKYASNALLLAAVAQAKQDVSVDSKDAAHLMEGILMGALNAEFGDLSACVQDGELILKDVENAVKDFKSRDFHDITEGLKAIGDILMLAKKGMTDCPDVWGDWRKLEEMAVAYSNPESVAWHIGKDLVVHGHDIYKEVKGAIKAYDATPKNYYDLGFNVGKAGSQILVGTEEAQLAYTHIKKREVAQVLSGIMKSFGGHFNLENLLFCIYEEDQALLMLDVSIQAFESAW